ncbi:MAG: hypothetical protein KDJ50_01465 [Alphaproteobacteria bacterium]|nr:hypothetical protein [Alphaproteobacteria bacterium]
MVTDLSLSSEDLPDLEEIYYKKELRSFLMSFVEDSQQDNPTSTAPRCAEDVLRDILHIFESEGFLHPAELRSRLTQKYLGDASDDLLQIFEELDHSRYQPDVMTGFLQKPHLGLASALGHLYARTHNKNVALIEVDFSNMGGTNDFHQIQILRETDSPLRDELISIIENRAQHPEIFEAMLQGSAGERGLAMLELFQDTQKQAIQLTDRTARLIALTIQKNLQDALPNGGTILPIRAGGDELRLIVEGINSDNIEKIKHKIHREIEDRMAELGLHDHAHLKYPDDDWKRGFGAAIAILDMRAINPAKVIHRADEEIKHNKNYIGHDRLGIVPDDTYEKPFRTLFAASPSQMPDEAKGDIERAIQIAMNNIRKAAVDLKTHFDALKPKGSFTIQDRMSALEQKIDFLEHSVIHPFSPVVPAYLLRSIEHAPLFSTPAERRFQALRTELKERDIAVQSDYQKEQIRNYALRTTSKDPTADVWMPNDLPETVEIFYNDSKKLEQHLSLPGLRPYSLSIGFQNLAGLNNELGHDGANAVLHDMAHEIIVKALKNAGLKNGDFQIAHYGAAEFHLVIRPAFFDSDDNLRVINDSFMKEVAKDIKKLTETLSAVPIHDYLEQKNIEPDEEHSSKLDGKNLGDVRSIKKEREIRGIPVTTVYRPVDLTGKTAGYYLQQQREVLETKISATRVASLVDKFKATAGHVSSFILTSLIAYQAAVGQAPPPTESFSPVSEIHTIAENKATNSTHSPQYGAKEMPFSWHGNLIH